MAGSAQVVCLFVFLYFSSDSICFWFIITLNFLKVIFRLQLLLIKKKTTTLRYYSSLTREKETVEGY